MGMDLIPKSKRVNAGFLEYNLSGWRWMYEKGTEWGVNTSQWRFMNDGDPISAAVCRAMAKAIRAHIDEYNATFGGDPSPDGYGLAPAMKHADLWEKSGGWRQW